MHIKLYFSALVLFLAVDFLWLGLIAKNFYAKEIGHLMRPDVNWVAAIIFYLIFIAGLLVFVIQPSLSHTWMHAALMGAFFGLVAYATFDLTNLALLKNWPVLVTIVDLVWGAFIGALVSGVVHLLATKLF